MRRRTTCDYCGLSHHAVRRFQGQWVCAVCDYLDLVRADSLDLKEAIEHLNEKLLCAYCGDRATDVEHVIPRSTGLPTFTVPACKDCNSIAGDRVFGCFEEKAEYVKTTLKIKHQKILRVPEWDKDELREVSYSLRKSIIAAQARRDWVQQRLDWSWLQTLFAARAH